MGLFKPAWQSKNQEKALKAVGKEKNQTNLEEIAINAPLENVRKKAESVLSDIRRQKINDLILEAQKGSQSAMNALFDDKKNWGIIVSNCFGDVRYKGSVENLNKLISRIAIANYTEKSGGQKPADTCPSFSNSSCVFIGNNQCPFSQNLECYPVCPHQEKTFFEEHMGIKWLKG